MAILAIPISVSVISKKPLSTTTFILAFLKKRGDIIGEGNACGNLGVTYYKLGDFKQAIEYSKLQLSIAKKMEDRNGEVIAYGNLGNVYFSLGDVKQSIEYHNIVLRIANEIGDSSGQGRAYLAIGNVFDYLGELNKALDYYQSSLRQYNGMRSLLQSEDTWKITFRDTFQDVNTAVWRTLVKLQKTDEALCVAEQGRAQALVELMKIQYGFEILPPVELKETISDNVSNISTETVFLALQSNKMNFWLLGDANGNIQYMQKPAEDENEDMTTSLQRLMKNAFAENDIKVRVKCEDRSLEELRGD